MDINTISQIVFGSLALITAVIGLVFTFTHRQFFLPRLFEPRVNALPGNGGPMWSPGLLRTLRNLFFSNQRLPDVERELNSIQAPAHRPGQDAQRLASENASTNRLGHSHSRPMTPSDQTTASEATA